MQAVFSNPSESKPAPGGTAPGCSKQQTRGARTKRGIGQSRAFIAGTRLGADLAPNRVLLGSNPRCSATAQQPDRKRREREGGKELRRVVTAFLLAGRRPQFAMGMRHIVVLTQQWPGPTARSLQVANAAPRRGTRYASRAPRRSQVVREAGRRRKRRGMPPPDTEEKALPSHGDCRTRGNGLRAGGLPSRSREGLTEKN